MKSIKITTNEDRKEIKDDKRRNEVLNYITVSTWNRRTKAEN